MRASEFYEHAGGALRLPAPAKLNLFLHITGRRADGYHLLQTVFQLLDYGDTLELTATPGPGITLEPALAGVGLGDNLIYRAARLLQQTTGATQGAHIRCDKVLPMGGGLGGGSSNAATTLLGLNALWHTGLGIPALTRLGLTLGADVPVFVRGQSAWAEGIGDALTPIDLPERWYLVVTPPCGVDTARIFSDKHLTRNTQPIKLAAFLEGGWQNDCEPVVRHLFPLVDRVMEHLSRFGKPHLTGTGASVFMAFEHQREAAQLAAGLPPDWRCFVARGVTRSPLHQRLDQEN